MKNQDLRCIKTDMLILNAFYSCIKETNFEKLKVSDICARSQISRNTFYSRYSDKYDLLDKLFQKFETRFFQQFKQTMMLEIREGNIRNAVKWYLNVIEENSELFIILMKCAPERFIDTLKQAVIHKPMRTSSPKYDTLVQNIPVQLTLEYMLYGMIGFTKSWINHKEQFPKEQAIEQLEILCREAVCTYNSQLQ